MPVRLSHKKAFTLVELLVVIAIIGLLSTVAVISLGPSRARARNAKRTADIMALVKAFDLYFEANGSFPDSSAGNNGVTCVSAACTGAWGGWSARAAVDNAIFPTYMGSKPVDPVDPGRPGRAYLYCNAADCNTWVTDNGNVDGPSIIYSLEGVTTCSFGTRQGGGSSYTGCVASLEQRF